MQILIRRCVEDAAAYLGLHFLHMSEDPFSHDAGHIQSYQSPYRRDMEWSNLLDPDWKTMYIAYDQVLVKTVILLKHKTSDSMMFRKQILQTEV